ncbi:MAG: nucleotide sugar dehydrogenase [Verrucomicrobiota bacterium]|nr:nucleotide sugar dehydrogenase [Verrucomicrobiota bacterium]
MNPIKNVSVCGLGKLGACIAATLAQRGFNVVGVDIDPEKVRRVNACEPPVDEPLLAQMITEGHSRLRATTDPAETVGTDVTFFIPPSPSLPDGSFSNEYLLRAMQPIAAAMRAAGKRAHLFVCSSTTTPNAGDTVLIPMLEKETGWSVGEGFGYCYNPEFIALGNVVNGLLDPDLVLIGESDEASGGALEQMYRRYVRNDARIARMSVISAELTKISVNSYITMKISFTNQLRMIAQRFPKADIHTVLDAIGSDSRINHKYLRAGTSFGGPCFPRDNRLLAYAAKQAGVHAPLAEATDVVNEATKEDLLAQVQSRAKPGDTVAVLGLAYKPDTYITEESAGLFLAQTLKRHGYRVLVHDFAAKPENSPALFEFDVLDNVADLAQRNEVTLAVICCPWPQYREAKFASGTTVLTPWRY